MREGRSLTFYLLSIFFGLYVLFLYGPMIVIFVLSFQGSDGGMTFPMRGLSLHWFEKLWEGGGIVDIGSAFDRSLELGLTVMVLTVVFSTLAGLAYRRKFTGSGILFYVAVASLIVPSIVTSMGIGLMFRLIDEGMKAGPAWMSDGYTTALGLFTSGLGAHLTWTLPFGLLIMFAIFNRFDGRLEEAARDLGATPWQTFRHVVLPLILPALVGVGLFGFTLSWDEIARSSQVLGGDTTLPLQLQALTTTVTTAADLRPRNHDDGRVLHGHRDGAARHRSLARSPEPLWIGRRQGLKEGPTQTGAADRLRRGPRFRRLCADVGLDEGAQLGRDHRLDPEPTLESRDGLVQQHAEPAHRAMLPQSCLPQQLRFERRIDDVTHQGSAFQAPDVEVEPRLAFHAERRGIDQEAGVGEATIEVAGAAHRHAWAEVAP